MKKPWREAATLIVIARDASKNLKFDYKVLTFKRTEKTSFMPNSMCFPGGGVDKTDEVKEWTNVFKNHKIPFEELRAKPGTKRPFVFDHREGGLERETSLRLTAIRETFEELGVVLCRDPADPSTSPFSSFLHRKDLDVPVWQKKIHNHEHSMMEFCEKFKVVPDIMNVHDWSCWLTPTFLRSKRFETAFFLVALNSVPPVYPESHEVQEFRWDTPDELLRLHQAEELWLPPPQFCEIRRLNTIKSIDKLIEIAKSRNGTNMELIMPMQLKAQDGMLHVLPGDELYPENPNYNETSHNIDQYADKTMEELRMSAKKLNRGEMSSLHQVQLFTNITPTDGHISLESDPINKM